MRLKTYTLHTNVKFALSGLTEPLWMSQKINHAGFQPLDLNFAPTIYFSLLLDWDTAPQRCDLNAAIAVAIRPLGFQMPSGGVRSIQPLVP
jgi:hypothetical protein